MPYNPCLLMRMRFITKIRLNSGFYFFSLIHIIYIKLNIAERWLVNAKRLLTEGCVLEVTDQTGILLIQAIYVPLVLDFLLRLRVVHKMNLRIL